MAKKYTLGRGKLYFDQFVKGTQTKTGERYFGNTPEFNLTVESESLDHFNSDEGVRVKDDSVLLELNRTGSFITDHISPENIALFFLAEASTLTVASATAQEYTFTRAVEADRYYQIGESASNPTGDRNISNVTIVDADNSGTTFVEGTDYTVDLALGRLYVPAGSAMVGKKPKITRDIAASTRTQIVSQADAVVEGALRFIAYNPKGELLDYYFPHVRVSPNGDFALKGDEWQQLSFTIEVLKLDENTASMYIDGRPAAA